MKQLFKFYFSFFLFLSLAAGPCAAVSTGTVAAGPASPATAQLVATLLEEGHYSHKPLTVETSRELMKLYLRMYDPYRLFFLASDIGEFNGRFGPGLAQRIKYGDVTPAYFIFDRFMKRLEERVGWTHELVRSTFTFTSDRTMLVDRREAAWPGVSASSCNG